MEIKDEFTKEEIDIHDIKNICDEIVRQDRNGTRKMFDKNKIKSKYGKAVSDIQEQFDKAMQSGDTKKVEKALEKFSKVVERISKLTPNMDIRRIVENNEVKYKINDTFEKGNVSKLTSMFSHAKINEKNRLESIKQEEKLEKERKTKEKIYADVDKSRYDRMIEENERQARENERESIRRAIDMSSFEAETRGKIESEVDAAMKMYGDSDSGRAYKEIKKARDSMPDYLKE